MPMYPKAYVYVKSDPRPDGKIEVGITRYYGSTRIKKRRNYTPTTPSLHRLRYALLSEQAVVSLQLAAWGIAAASVDWYTRRKG